MKPFMCKIILLLLGFWSFRSVLALPMLPWPDPSGQLSDKPDDILLPIRANAPASPFIQQSYNTGQYSAMGNNIQSVLPETPSRQKSKEGSADEFQSLNARENTGFRKSLNDRFGLKFNVAERSEFSHYVQPVTAFEPELTDNEKLHQEILALDTEGDEPNVASFELWGKYMPRESLLKAGDIARPSKVREPSTNPERESFGNLILLMARQTDNHLGDTSDQLTNKPAEDFAHQLSNTIPSHRTRDSDKHQYLEAWIKSLKPELPHSSTLGPSWTAVDHTGKPFSSFRLAPKTEEDRSPQPLSPIMSGHLNLFQDPLKKRRPTSYDQRNTQDISPNRQSRTMNSAPLRPISTGAPQTSRRISSSYTSLGRPHSGPMSGELERTTSKTFSIAHTGSTDLSGISGIVLRSQTQSAEHSSRISTPIPEEREAQKHTLDGLPHRVFDYMTTFLAPKDIARLGMASREMSALVTDARDIRTLYSKHHIYAEIVSPVRLYHFCVENPNNIITEAYKTIDECLANVNRLSEWFDWPIYRLQFMYDIVTMSPENNIHSAKLLSTFKIMLDTTEWSAYQSESLLYYTAPRYNASVPYFAEVFNHVCRKQPTEFLHNACSSSVTMLTTTELLDVRSSKYLQEYGSPLFQALKQRLVGYNDKFCQIPVIFTPKQYQTVILSYLSSGANIHHPCLYRLVRDYFMGDDVALNNPDSVYFMEDLIDMGFAINDPNRESLIVPWDDLSLVQLILNAGADIDGLSSTGETALYAACRDNYIEKVQLLLDYGANPNISTSTGDTPLMASSSEEVYTMLLSHKSDPSAKNANGETPIFMATLRYDSIPLTDLLLNHSAVIDHANLRKQTLLMMLPSPRMAEYLLKFAEMRNAVNAQDETGQTALHYAVIHWRHVIVRMLLEAGADPNVPDLDLQTPLMKADNADVAELLLDRGQANSNFQDIYGYTALIMAVANRNVELVKVLLAYGARVDLKTLDGLDAITIAKRSSSSRLAMKITELLQNASVDQLKHGSSQT